MNPARITPGSDAAGLKGLRPRLGLPALTAAVILAATVSGIAGCWRAAAKDEEIPIAVVKRGEIDLRVHAIGELQASHAVMLSAPAIGGDALQITQLARPGALVKKGDLIIEFDPSEQHFKLDQNRSELLQADEDITKARADAAVLAAEDKVALLRARYDVRRAELDVQKDELVSKIDADKNQLALQQARRALTELEKDIESHTASGQATIYLAREKHNKASLAMDQASQNLVKMRVTAPMDGLVSIQKNQNASGGFFFTGMSLPDYHSGDQVQAGSAIAQLVDPHGMDLVAKISERDQGNVRPGQAVEVSFDALPGEPFRGSVKNVGGMSMRQIFSDEAGGTSDVAISLPRMDPRLRSGFTAQVVFLGQSGKSVLYVPRQALFLKDGKHIVYVKNGDAYEQREVKIESQSESRAAITGLSEGTRIAMVDPTAPRKSTGDAASAAGGTL